MKFSVFLATSLAAAIPVRGKVSRRQVNRQGLAALNGMLVAEVYTDSLRMAFISPAHSLHIA